MTQLIHSISLAKIVGGRGLTRSEELALDGAVVSIRITTGKEAKNMASSLRAHMVA